MAGHTPWTFGYVEDSSDWVVWSAEDKDGDPETTFTPAICTLSSSCGRDEARLIAAAPELLGALWGLLGNSEIARFHLQGTEEGMLIGSALFDTIQQARAAIAKATQP